MSKPTPVVILLLFIVATSLLAFTISDSIKKDESYGPKASLNLSAGQPGKISMPALANPLAKVNPAHGKPGHQCGIAVGAPLPESSINAIQTTTAAAPAMVNPAQSTFTDLSNISSTAINTATNASTAAGLNPAHGQPGHRCEIAVGAPLNSAPQTAAATPAKPPKVNPAHGQPFHRCDISVGAPLNSKTSPVSTTPPAAVVTPTILTDTAKPQAVSLPDSSKQ